MVAALLTLLLLSALTCSVTAQTSNCTWAKTGCYKDPGTAHPLLVSVIPSLTEDTTVENCQAACASRNYPYAGLENGYQCWCDYGVAANAVAQADSYCNVACFGDGTEICGGYGAMGVFHNSCVVNIITVTATATATATATTTTKPVTTKTSSSTASFSTVTLTVTITPTPTSTKAPPPPPPPPTTLPPTTTSRRRPHPSPTTTPVQCDPDDFLCCLLYPDYCDDDGPRATATALP